MGCYFPVGCYRNDGTQAYRPCGTCMGCRLEYARNWAIRCVQEASIHDKNCFITLTYNDQNLPDDGSVSKAEIQLFMKRLRRKVEPKTVRFFGCGEYGEKFERPHYHLCLFGYDFPDKEVFTAKRWRKENHGLKADIIYTSKMLESVWDKGFHTIGELTFESAGYVARYCTKKINGKKAPEHYQGKRPEFALMSRMPGIGKEWFEKYGKDVYPKDFFTMDGKKLRPCRYYDSLLEKKRPEQFEKIKERRKEYAEKKLKENSIRQMQREKYRKLITKTLNRSMEDGADQNIRDIR